MAKNPQDELKALRQQTFNMSSPDAMRKAKAYQTLRRTSGVDELLSFIDDAPIPIMMLLSEISTENPVSKADRGNIEAMIAAWKKWGHAKNRRVRKLAQTGGSLRRGG